MLDDITNRYKVTEEFIEHFANILDNVDWYYISLNQKLSEQFMEKYENKVEWDYISYKQKLSEEFIEKFEKKVNWNNIFKHQTLSKEFKQKHCDKLC